MNGKKWQPYYGDEWEDIPNGEAFQYVDESGRVFGFVIKRKKWSACSANRDRVGSFLGEAIKCSDAMKLVENIYGA